jgi:tetratricopeptide (TPR) repeat protein
MTTRTLNQLGVIGALILLNGCASQNSTLTENDVLKPERRLAWMEGDLQNNYQPDRKVAEDRLSELEKSVDPNDADEYLEYLSVLDASGKVAEAEKKIKSYMFQNPKEKRAVFLLGVHYMRRGKKELAAHFFNELEKDAGFVWKSLLHNNLGMMALQDKNRPAAMAYFEKAVKAQPPTAAPYVNLGALYLQSRSYTDALPLFEKARDIDPEFEDAALGLGIALEGTGKIEQAQEVYADYTSSHPNALSVLYNHAVVLGNRLKRREEAAQVMLRYIQRGGKETAKAHEIIQTWR